MSDYTVESALAEIDGGGIVAGTDARCLHVLVPEESVSDTEYQAAQWLLANGPLVDVWLASLGEKLFSDDRVIVDDERNWLYALRLLRRATWPDQDSPNNCETLLMSFAWWCHCVGSRGKRLADHYASIIARLTVPGAGSGEEDGIVEERVRIKALANIGRGARMLDASFEMDPKHRAWAKSWMQSGFTKVEVAPKTLAALISSDAPSDVMSPWSAFSIIIPPGLCDPVRRLWCGASTEDGTVVLLSAVDAQGAATATDPDTGRAGAWCTAERSAMLKNLMRGACIAIENGSAQKKSDATVVTKDRSVDDRLPFCERWCISAPVRIDLRESVIEQWNGKRRSGKAKSQFCVRGHYREQACGERFSKRKRIWIHPHWKGDRSAIALLRRVKISTEIEP